MEQIIRVGEQDKYIHKLYFRQNFNNKRITKRVLYIFKNCSPAIGGFFKKSKFSIGLEESVDFNRDIERHIGGSVRVLNTSWNNRQTLKSQRLNLTEITPWSCEVRWESVSSPSPYSNTGRNTCLLTGCGRNETAMNEAHLFLNYLMWWSLFIGWLELQGYEVTITDAEKWKV